MSPRAPQSLNRIEFLVLSVLTEGPRHGYGIASEIGSRTEGEVKVRPGSLYRVLDRLVRRELIAPANADPRADEDERRSYYEITGRGAEAVRVEARLLAAVAKDVLDARERPA